MGLLGGASLLSAETLVLHFSENSPGLLVGNKASVTTYWFSFNLWSYLWERKVVRTDSRARIKGKWYGDEQGHWFFHLSTTKAISSGCL